MDCNQVTDAMVDAYVEAVNAHLGSMTGKQWEIERFNPAESIRKVARVGLESALRAHAESLAGAGWREIESAPRDGTAIQLGNANCVWIGRYIDRYQSGFVPPQKWHSMMFNHDHVPRENRYQPPTHWREMPLPPTAAPQSPEREAL